MSSIVEGRKPPLLEMQAICRRFAGVIALNNVEFAISAGEVVALIGENGAGKSTLMKIIGGIHQPTSGKILIDGQARTIRGAGDAMHAGIALIHQELNVVDNLDVAGNVYLGREILKPGPLRTLDRQRMADATAPHLARLGLPISPNTPLALLSLGQRQMVEIARSLSLNARLVIMDEPTSSLTMTETERLLAVIRDLRNHGVAVIYISHRLGEVEAVADRVVALRDGKNAGELAKGEISHDRMVNLMVGRDLQRPTRNAADRSAALAKIDQAPIISVTGLRTRAFAKEEVSFDVRRGEIFGVAGLIGSGRSEVAEALFGVTPAVAGEVVIDGKPVRIHNASDAIRRGIYLVPEDRRRCGLVVDMTIRDNVTLPSVGRFTRGGLIVRALEDAATTDAIKNLSIKTPSGSFLGKNLSGGNQQKVVLSKWLEMNRGTDNGARLIIFDEPTRGIDVRAKGEIYDLMRRLASDGVGVMMISSDMEEVVALSDRVAVMHEGRITGILSGDEITEDGIMHLAFGRRKAA